MSKIFKVFEEFRFVFLVLFFEKALGLNTDSKLFLELLLSFWVPGRLSFV